MTDLDDASGALDSLKRQALEWVDHLVSGEAVEQDADAVKRWRMRSPAHARAFAEAVRLRRALGLAARALAKERECSIVLKRFPPARQSIVSG